MLYPHLVFKHMFDIISGLEAFWQSQGGRPNMQCQHYSVFYSVSAWAAISAKRVSGFVSDSTPKTYLACTSSFVGCLFDCFWACSLVPLQWVVPPRGAMDSVPLANCAWARPLAINVRTQIHSLTSGRAIPAPDCGRFRSMPPKNANMMYKLDM